MDHLKTALALTDAAFDRWSEIRDRPDLNDEVGMGADGTATMRVDQLLDDAILEEAKQHGVGVISEESGATPGDQNIWAYVDPLDGSRNASRGIPLFCTSIAMAEGPGMDGLRSGVVRQLVTGEEWSAIKGGPLMHDGHAGPSRPFTDEEVMVAVIADSATDEIKAEQGRRGHHLRDFGSAALELAMVAQGALDAMIVKRPWLRNIDVAAGLVLVEAAGGKCIDPAGGPVRIGFDVTTRIGLVAARSSAALEAVS